MKKKFPPLSTSVTYSNSDLLKSPSTDSTSIQIASVPSSTVRLVTTFQEVLLQDSWNKFQLTNTLLSLALLQEPEEDLFMAIIKFYCYKSRTIELLQNTIIKEFEHCSKEASTIFRSDNLGTRLISKYFEIEGAEYLNECLANTVNAIAAFPLENEAEKNQKMQKQYSKLLKICCTISVNLLLYARYR